MDVSLKFQQYIFITENKMLYRVHGDTIHS